MALSRFVVPYLGVRPGEHVLYDVLTDQFVGLNDPALEAVRAWEHRPPSGDAERELHRSLRGEAMLVEDRAEDDRRLRVALDEAAAGIPGTLYLTLLPTLACNLACDYCFQKDHPSTQAMNAQVEAATVEWALRKVDAARARTLRVHYFGGEPLTRKDLLLRTAEAFAASMAARGGRFEWELTTNGVALSSAWVGELAAFGEGAIKITFDGDRPTHDAMRVFRDGTGSFDRIFENLLTVSQQHPNVKLWVGGNFAPGQLPSYEALLRRMVAAGLRGRIEQIRFKPVVPLEPGAATGCGGCAVGQGEVATAVRLAELVEESGLLTEPLRLSPQGPCELHWRDSYVVDPSGRVYKCPAVAGRPEMAVGNVRSDGELAAPLLQLRPWEQCGDCPFLPICVGGCLGSQYLKTGRMDEVFCRKPMFEELVRREVIQRYLAEFPPATPDGDGPVTLEGEAP